MNQDRSTDQPTGVHEESYGSNAINYNGKPVWSMCCIWTDVADLRMDTKSELGSDLGIGEQVRRIDIQYQHNQYIHLFLFCLFFRNIAWTKQRRKKTRIKECFLILRGGGNSFVQSVWLTKICRYQRQIKIVVKKLEIIQNSVTKEAVLSFLAFPFIFCFVTLYHSSYLFFDCRPSEDYLYDSTTKKHLSA